MSPLTPMRCAHIALAILLCVTGGTAMAEDTYRWVDERGQVNFSDLPPPPGARQVEIIRGAAGPADPTLVYSVRKAAADFPVTLYTGKDCGDPCALGRDLLARRGIPFSEKEIVTEDDLAAYRTRFGAPDEVPAIAVGSQTMKGFEAGRWGSMLDDAGYPKTPIPPR